MPICDFHITIYNFDACVLARAFHRIHVADDFYIILYFNVSWVDYLVGKVKFLHKVKPFFAVLEDYSVRELAYVLWLSTCRFVIFTSQYIILMLVFLPELSIASMLPMIFILFFIQSAVPSLDIFDFSVRSFVASNLFAYITTQELAVMAIV